MMNELQNQELYTEDNNERTLSRPIGILYSFVLFGSAALILILFEDLLQVNLYVVYMVVGLIMGLSLVLILHLFLKKV